MKTNAEIFAGLQINLERVTKEKQSIINYLLENGIVHDRKYTKEEIHSLDMAVKRINKSVMWLHMAEHYLKVVKKA